MAVRIFGTVVIAATLWACGGESTGGGIDSKGGGGSDASGGRGGTSGALGGASGAQAGTSAGGQSGGGGALAGTSGTAAGGAGGGAGEPCQGLECDRTTCTMGQCTQLPCADGTSTTLSGTVYDPAGKVPLYNALVYVPNAPIPPAVEGASCAVCDVNELGPVTGALTGPDGRFVIEDMPVGADIPVVIQIGKWRRQITVPSVPRCVDTALTDTEQTSLPSNRTEGDIPRIAVTTGGADSLECLLLRMGVESSEFTTVVGGGRVHLYAGTDSGAMSVATKVFNSGETFPSADELWSTVDTLNAYDLVVLSCEGDSTENPRPASARQAIYDYTTIGGRILASHWHHRWISQGPDPWPDVATFSDRENPQTPAIAEINTTFPRGQALGEWLVNVGASTTYGELVVLDVRDNVQAVNSEVATEWVRTINENQSNTPAILNFSFRTPVTVPEDMKCGRVGFTDVHVLVPLDVTEDFPGDPFPSHCVLRDLSPQEKLLEFMLFDLTSCVLQSSAETPGR